MPPQRKTPKTTRTTTTKASHRPTTGGGVSRRTLAIALGGAALIAVALVAGSIVLGGGEGASSGSVNVDTTLVDGIPQEGTTLGAADAKVTLIMWEDFQCPACRAYQEAAFPGIVEEYVRTGKAKVEFKGLAFIGEDSDQALRAALAAGEQGKFWQMEKLLYENQGGENEGWVTDELIRSLAGAIGLDVARLEQDMDSAAIGDRIEEMQTEATERQVGGTPTFFVSVDRGEPYHVQPETFDPAAFRPILDDALAG